MTAQRILALFVRALRARGKTMIGSMAELRALAKALGQENFRVVTREGEEEVSGEPEDLFREACALACEDREVDDDEQALLFAFREHLGIPEDRARELFEEGVARAGELAEARRAADDPAVRAAWPPALEVADLATPSRAARREFPLAAVKENGLFAVIGAIVLVVFFGSGSLMVLLGDDEALFMVGGIFALVGGLIGVIFLAIGLGPAIEWAWNQALTKAGVPEAPEVAVAFELDPAEPGQREPLRVRARVTFRDPCDVAEVELVHALVAHQRREWTAEVERRNSATDRMETVREERSATREEVAHEERAATNLDRNLPAGEVVEVFGHFTVPEAPAPLRSTRREDWHHARFAWTLEVRVVPRRGRGVEAVAELPGPPD